MGSLYEKLRYKLWRHLSKQYTKGSGAKEIFDSIVRRYRQGDNAELKFLPLYEGEQNIIVTAGYYETGSSAVVGWLMEFDNIAVLGDEEPLFVKEKKDARERSVESRWFISSGFLDLADALMKGAEETELDLLIKKFIITNNYTVRFRCTPQKDTIPEIYGRPEFLEMNEKFLYDILDLDELTQNYMRGHRFPGKFRTGDTTPNYDNCSFMHSEGVARYLFYRVRSMNPAEMHKIIAQYLRRFFSLVPSPCVAHDQMLPGRMLEIANQFMEKPIRQVCVMRDPRDRFMGMMLADDFLYYKRDLEGYCEGYLQNLRNFDKDAPNRLVVRFEDLILRYDDSFRKIAEFLGLEISHHVAPRTFFVPEVSVKNLGYWHHFHDRDFMRRIEQRMGEYCYYPEREDLSQEARALLCSSGNWDGIF